MSTCFWATLCLCEGGTELTDLQLCHYITNYTERERVCVCVCLGDIGSIEVLTESDTTICPFPHNLSQVLLPEESASLCCFPQFGVMCAGCPFCLFLAGRDGRTKKTKPVSSKKTSLSSISSFSPMRGVFWWLLCWWSCFAAVPLSYPACCQPTWL